MSASRRDALVEAGVALALRQRFQDWLGSVDTRAIADAAGVTTGSFFHHFGNRAEFAEAVAAHFVDRWAARVQHLVDHAEGVNGDADPDLQRKAAAAEWEALTRPSEAVPLQHLLWIARDRSVADDASQTAGDLLRRAYGELTARIVPVYEQGNEAFGREMLPPFTTVDLAVLMNALAEGLQMRAAVDPAAVRDELYADGVSALYLSMTRPRVERSDDVARLDLSSLTAATLRRPPERVGEPAAAGTWRSIAAAAAHLFADRSARDVKVAEVAEAAGVSTTTVYHHFSSVHAVAAAGIAVHLPELIDISIQPLTAQEGPLVRIEQVLVRYVELLQENRGIAEALVAEAARMAGPAEHDGRRSAADELPLQDLVVDHVRELRVRGLLRRRIESDRLARMLLQLATVQSLVHREDPVERIVDEVLTVVFDGALAGAAES